MSDIKIVLKQYLKSFLQKTILPISYNLAKKKNIDEKLCILADSNCNSTPESMELIKAELTAQGYKVKEMYLDFSKSGIVGIMKYMTSFMKAYANCRALFICNYFVPCTACNKRSDTTVVQLWHSCGALKKFGYDSSEDISPHLKSSVTKNIDLITVSSQECVRAFNSAFRLSGDIVKPLGVSRTDMFFQHGFEQRCRDEFFEQYPQYKGKKIVLYAPTFRGNASKCWCVGEEYAARLQEKLGDDYAVLIKMHPRLHSNLTNCDFPTNKLFPVADLLITDYSSLVFEYALFKKPIVLFVPDLQEYKRGFYLDFELDMPGVIVTDGEKLSDEVQNAFKSFYSGSYDRFLEKYMSACDGNATKRICRQALR